MAEENSTTRTEFILLGFTENKRLQFLLFVMFLLIYLLILVGNTSMVTIIMIDSRLHTPMYFFLRNLSLLDIFYSTVIAPRTLMTFVTTKTISFTGCALQFFLFCIGVTCECFLLGVMAYDRFIAICKPLLYTVIMSKGFCRMLVAGSYLAGCLNAVLQTPYIFNLSFCRSHVINHFFCDVTAVLKLSCSDTRMADLILLAYSIAIVVLTVPTILVSYMYILVAILKISSVEGRKKAFSTCASHLTAVSIFFGTAIFMYVRPGSKNSMEQDKIVSVFYTLVIPMLNPLIYSLRNKEVKEAVKRLLEKRAAHQR